MITDYDIVQCLCSWLQRHKCTFLSWPNCIVGLFTAIPSWYLYRSWSVFHPRRPRSHWPHCHNPSQGRKTMPYLQGDLVLAEIGKRRIRTMRSMRPRSRRMKNNSRYIKIWRWMTLSCPTMKSWKKSTLYASLKKAQSIYPKSVILIQKSWIYKDLNF